MSSGYKLRRTFRKDMIKEIGVCSLFIVEQKNKTKINQVIYHTELATGNKDCR